MTKCNQCNIGNVVDEWCPRCGVEQPAPPVVKKEPAPKPTPKPVPKAAPRAVKPAPKPGIINRVIKKATKK